MPRPPRRLRPGPGPAGPVLDNLADYTFTRPEAVRLQQLRLAALEVRIDADLALGRHDALTAELDGLVR